MASSPLSTCSLYAPSYFIPKFHPISDRSRSTKNRTNLAVVSVARRDQPGDDHHKRGQKRNHSGHLVDENMIVLRRRIHEMKMAERNYEPPSDWMEWEKEYFARWDEMVCNLVGILQAQLMNTRPSLALGVISLLTLSLPLSAAVVFLQLMEMSKVFSAGILHINIG